VFGDSGIETKGTICNIKIQVFAYADDIVLVGRATGGLKDVIINLRKAAKEVGLQINIQETKCIEVIKAKSIITEENLIWMTRNINEHGNSNRAILDLFQHMIIISLLK
jgi:hypothetical protein